MSWRAPSRPSLRHHCDEPSPHPEIASFPTPPLAKACKNKEYFVESSSSARGKDYDVLRKDKLLETTKTAPDTSIKCFPPSGLVPRLIGRQVYRDFTPFPPCTQPFIACSPCCCDYSYCATPDVYQQNFGSSRPNFGPSRGRLYERPKNGSRCCVEGTTLADNILLPTNFPRMAYERERWNLGGSTGNYDDVARKRAILLAGIPGEGISGNEARNSNFEINVDRVYAAGAGCPSRLVACQTGFQMTNGTFQRVQETSKKIRKLDSFYEGDSHEDIGKEKRFKAAEPNTTGSETDNIERSWQGFSPVGCLNKHINPCPNIGSTTKPCEIPKVVSQDEIAALPLQIKKRVSSKGHSSCNKAHTEFRLQTKQRVSSTGLSCNQPQAIGSTSGTSEQARSSSCDTCVGDDGIRCHPELSARYPSNESECANRNTVRSGEPATEETSGFISLDSTTATFFTLINKMRTSLISCPYCSQTFTQYHALKTHVQTLHPNARTSADNYAPETRGHKAELRSACEETALPIPSVVGSPEDEATILRATSVIKFAGQKKEG